MLVVAIGDADVLDIEVVVCELPVLGAELCNVKVADSEVVR